MKAGDKDVEHACTLGSDDGDSDKISDVAGSSVVIIGSSDDDGNNLRENNTDDPPMSQATLDAIIYLITKHFKLS